MTTGAAPSVSRPALLAGLVLFGLAFAGAMAVRCPTPVQAWAFVIAAALGAGCLILALTGAFSMSLAAQGITSTGGAAVLLLFFAFTPGVMERLGCDDLALQLRVCEQRDCPGGAIAAVVSILGHSTTELSMDGYGEGRYRYGAGRIGDEVQIFAKAEGFLRSAPLALRLPDAARTLIQIPLTREGLAQTELLAPSVAAAGEDWLPPRRLDLAALRSQPPGSRAAYVEREGGSDLATWGVAAFEAGEFEIAAEILEAERAKDPAAWQVGAPFLAAAYVRLGRSDVARTVLEEVESEAGEGGSEAAAPAARSVLTENAARAVQSLPAADASMIRNAARAYRVP